MRYRVIANPLRRFVLIEEADNVLRTTWPDEATWRHLQSVEEDRSLRPDLTRRLKAYFQGEPVEFSDLPTPSGPDFHQRCWEACRSIPRGEVRSYRQLTEMAGGEPGASRAAGQAMRRNRLPVIIPCHRVISSSGQLQGFAGSSDPASEMIRLKQRLLELEGCPSVSSQLGLFGAECTEFSLSEEF